LLWINGGGGRGCGGGAERQMKTGAGGEAEPSCIGELRSNRFESGEEREIEGAHLRNRA
jgi:hypothetical protein